MRELRLNSKWGLSASLCWWVKVRASSVEVPQDQKWTVEGDHSVFAIGFVVGLHPQQLSGCRSNALRDRKGPPQLHDSQGQRKLPSLQFLPRRGTEGKTLPSLLSYSASWNGGTIGNGVGTGAKEAKLEAGKERHFEWDKGISASITQAH